MDQLIMAKWIWPGRDVTTCNQHAIFRKSFQAKATDCAKVAISCDSDFRLYLNDLLVGKDQFPDYPQEKTYSEFSLEGFQDGENWLYVEAFYNGEDSSVYAKGKAGLLGAVSFSDGRSFVTDSSWEAAINVAFTNGPISKVTGQLGFVKEYDALREGFCEYRPAFEREVAIGEFVKTLKRRPLPPLVNLGKVEAEVISDRPIERKVITGSFADMVTGDVVLDDPLFCTGRVIVGDLGRETVGEFYLDLVAKAGTIVDISHGEYLLGGVVHAKIGERNFTDRYICKDGENHFILPFRRLGARFLQLTITGPWEDVEVQAFGLWEMGQALPELSHFQTDNPQAEKLYEVAARTLRSCMHNHYEDCPWREQALYAYDSRMQMLFNYYSYGNYEFARASLDLLGRGLNRENGYLNLCAPTHYSVTIPCFSMVWVAGMAEYYLFSGDASLLEEFREQFKFMAEAYLSHCDGQLYVLKDDKSLWDFYEWVDMLSGDLGSCREEKAETRPKYRHALFNVYLYEMLMNLVRIFQVLGDLEQASYYEKKAAELGEAVEAAFWNEDEGCYATMIEHGKQCPMLHVHTQAAMLKNKLVPAEKIDRVLKALDSGRLVTMTLSPFYYYLEAMFDSDSGHRKAFVQLINKTYQKMVDDGATTFYETQDGHEAFDGAGSLCHAWSSIHSYYYGNKVLGIRPLQPGFKTFELKIYGSEFNKVSGEVPTPYGKIRVEWEKSAGKICATVCHPRELEMVVSSYPECEIQEVKAQEY